MTYNFTPSEYQKTIFKFFAEGVGNVVINAKAGSSKTTTAVMSLDYIPETKTVLFLAFNKSIATELQNRLVDKPNVTALTFHSLGYRILLENLGRIQLEEYKYKTYLLKNFRDLSESVFGKLEDKNRFLKNCDELTNLARYNKCQTAEEIGDVAEKYNIIPLGDEVYVVEKLLKWGKEHTDTIDYTDMEWLPYELGLNTYKYKYDWIIIDEAQDTSPIRQELFKKCFKRGTRFAAIGDKDQAINAWCGSDSSAFEHFLKEADTIKLDLPISYRCPKKVIELLQTLVPDIQAAPNAIEGEVNYDVSPYKAKSGDMVVCRNSLPLTVLYTWYIEKNIKAYIKGSDIGKGLISMLKNTDATTVGCDFKTDGAIPRLYKGAIKSVNKMVKEGLTVEDAVCTEKFRRLYDSIKTIEVLANGTTDLEYLKARINKIFKDENSDGICLTTVHKAKGLEADNVFVLCPSLMPSSLATKPWEIESEHNIQYVAFSRPKKTLNFVSEEMFSAQKAYAIDSAYILDEVLRINEKLKVLYHKDYLGSTDGHSLLITPEHKNFILAPKPEKTNTVKPKKEKIGANKFKKFLK